MTVFRRGIFSSSGKFSWQKPLFPYWLLFILSEISKWYIVSFLQVSNSFLSPIFSWFHFFSYPKETTRAVWRAPLTKAPLSLSPSTIRHLCPHFRIISSLCNLSSFPQELWHTLFFCSHHHSITLPLCCNGLQYWSTQKRTFSCRCPQ